jgi:hypothetical protein
MFKGSLPHKIDYISSKSMTKIEEYYEDTQELFFVVKVYSTFPVEHGKSLDSAKSWAGDGHRHILLDNTPLKNVRVIGLDIRGNGGRAYKVLIDDKYYVDLREDVILETILTVGIQAEGKLNGEYVWGKNGAQLKLIRVDSELHQQYIKGTTDRKTYSEIKGADIVPGGCYLMKSGTKKIYLGRFKHFKHEYDHDQGNYFKDSTWTNKRLVPSASHVFVEVHEYHKLKKTQSLQQILNMVTNGSTGTYYISMHKAKPKFVREEFKINLDGIDIPEMIRDIAESGSYDNNPYPHNYHHEHLSISNDKPIVNEVIKRFNLPITKN